MTKQINIIENLEAKLKIARENNEKSFEKFEKIYNDNYKPFLESFFKNDVLGIKKIISAIFQLELLNGKNNNEAFKVAIEKSVNILHINPDKRKKLANNLVNLELKKEKISEIIGNNTEFSHNKDFPVLEYSFERGIIDKQEFLAIYSEYKKNGNIKKSINILEKNKKNIISEQFNALNNSNNSEKIKSFKNEYSSEIKSISKKYPSNIVDGVVIFVGRRFYKSRQYKKNIESKKLRLKRTFKLALLRLLRIKYKGLNIDVLIKKINLMEDFESMFRLIMKLLEILPEKNELLEKDKITDKIDETEEFITEAEENKQKIINGEKSTIKISELLDKADKKLDKKTLDALLSDDVDFIGGEIKVRNKTKINKNIGDGTNGKNLLDGGINAGIINKETLIEDTTKEDEEENFEELSGEDLEIIYNELKIEFSFLDKQKLNFLISDDYENLNKTIEELTLIQIKLEKIEKLII